MLVRVGARLRHSLDTVALTRPLTIAMISHPLDLDIERAAATATGERFREAVGRYRIGVRRRGGVGEVNVTKTRRSPHFEGVFGLSLAIARGDLAACGGVFESGWRFYSYPRGRS